MGSTSRGESFYRFDDTLKYAVLMNTRGTHEILKLSSQMKFLESFVYVSTTYSNTHKKVIEEKIYPPPGDWRKIIKIAENYDNHTLETYASKILGEFPNTYTFTKALAEQVCSDFREKVPLTIFRPSVGKFLNFIHTKKFVSFKGAN